MMSTEADLGSNTEAIYADIADENNPSDMYAAVGPVYATLESLSSSDGKRYSGNTICESFNSIEDYD